VSALELQAPLRTPPQRDATRSLRSSPTPCGLTSRP